MIERQWLQSWFKGTPVRIAQRGPGPLLIEVPIDFSFETGRTQLLPALTAVLDKVAESLRRVRTAQVVLIAAPGDAAQSAKLAAQRGTRVRAYLLSRGVFSGQLATPTAAAEPRVQLRLQDEANAAP
jgi:outer membrane protein OmpA-like peptidoglycan-associated protein